MEYGSFGARLVAKILDAFIVAIPVHLVCGLFGISPEVAQVIHIGVFVYYDAHFVSSESQATLGKKVMGLKVTNTEGGRLSFGRAAGRHFAEWVSGALLCIGYFVYFFTERKQTLHDLIVDSVVVEA